MFINQFYVFCFTFRIYVFGEIGVRIEGSLFDWSVSSSYVFVLRGVLVFSCMRWILILVKFYLVLYYFIMFFQGWDLGRKYYIVSYIIKGGAGGREGVWLVGLVSVLIFGLKQFWFFSRQFFIFSSVRRCSFRAVRRRRCFGSFFRFSSSCYFI